MSHQLPFGCLSDSAGGATQTAPYPAGSSWLTHSAPTERQFQDHRLAMTSPLWTPVSALAVCVPSPPVQSDATIARTVAGRSSRLMLVLLVEPCASCCNFLQARPARSRL